MVRKGHECAHMCDNTVLGPRRADERKKKTETAVKAVEVGRPLLAW